MEIQKQATDAGIRLAAAGEVTLGAAERLQAELRECLAGARPVVLDLACVTEIDLAGLQVLVAAGRSFTALERPLTILRGTYVERVWAEAGYPCGEVSGGKDNHDGG
jgi:anti-anti-sigma regulatory factor